GGVRRLRRRHAAGGRADPDHRDRREGEPAGHGDAAAKSKNRAGSGEPARIDLGRSEARNPRRAPSFFPGQGIGTPASRLGGGRIASTTGRTSKIGPASRGGGGGPASVGGGGGVPPSPAPQTSDVRSVRRRPRSFSVRGWPVIGSNAVVPVMNGDSDASPPGLRGKIIRKKVWVSGPWQP